MQSLSLRITNAQGRRTYKSSRTEETLAWPARRRRAQGFTLVEVLVGCVILGMMTTGLCGCIWCGFSLVQSSRENLRANQIMVQRTEAIRLFNWDQIQDTNYLKPTFVEYYDPLATNALGVAYYGAVTATVPTNLPSAYRDKMRVITITLNWTNSTGRLNTPRSRQWQTQVARFGMQNYVFGGL